MTVDQPESPAPRKRPIWKTLLRLGAIGVGVLVLVFAVIQVVPYGRDHSNPPVREEPAWDSAETRALAVDACFDCHSNQTSWPWYSHIAPISWLVQSDVDNGREALNFSEWDREQEHADHAAEKVQEGEMPPDYYGWLHPGARLSSEEKQALIRGLQAMFGGEGEGEEEGED